MKMQGQVTQETVVEVPASIMWGAYRGLEHGRFIQQLLGDVIGKVDVLEGDGGVGTIVKITFPPGTPGIGFIRELFTKMDDEKRLKEIETIEGEYKDLRFDLFRIKYEILEKDAESSIVRSTMEYKMNEKLGHIASSVSCKHLDHVAQVIGKYLSDKRNFIQDPQ